jgi:DNA-binding transcriptional LysR family regulator
MDRLECDRMFVAVMETGSFSRAADRLGTSAGQASKLVRRLETKLNVQLLKRTTRALSPTEVGRAYFDRVKALIDDYDALDSSVESASGDVRGRLAITVPESFGRAQMQGALIDFARAYPLVELRVSFSDRVASLVDEGFDAAVRIGVPADATLVSRKLFDNRTVVAASPAYLERRGEPAEPADLADHACIIDTNYPEPLVWHFRVQESGETLRIQVSGRLFFSNGDAAVAAAEAGLGIVRVPTFIAGPRLREGALRPLLAAFEEPPRSSVHILYPPARHLAPKVRALVDFLAARFRGSPPWDEGW